MKKKIPIRLLIALLVIQFIPISTDNPPTDPSLALSANTDSKMTSEVAILLKNACFDCHSNNTVFPAYTRFQPVGWWVNGHIKGAEIS